MWNDLELVFYYPGVVKSFDSIKSEHSGTELVRAVDGKGRGFCIERKGAGGPTCTYVLVTKSFKFLALSLST